MRGVLFDLWFLSCCLNQFDGDASIRLAIENEMDIGEDSSIKPDLIKSTEAKTAQVSLNDCLACRHEFANFFIFF